MLVVLGCWCGLVARNALVVKADLDQLQADLASGGPTDLKSVHERTSILHADLIALRASGAPVLALAPHLGWLPVVGRDVEVAPNLIDAAIDLLDAGEIVLNAVSPLWPPQPVQGQSALAALAHSLSQLPPQLGEARAAVDRAAGRLEQIDIGSLSPSIGRQVERLASILPLLRSSFDLLDLSPSLLGFDRPKTYLVLMQNDDELRPTGGFISAVARLTLDRGEIRDLDVRDSYQVDDFQHKPYGWAPEPLLEFMGSQMWLFRDANWSPDFPTSARKAAELYTYGLDTPVDGVLGLNQKAVRDLVNALGPIELEPGQPPVDGSNLIEYMRAAWSPAPEVADIQTWIAGRKDFIAKLMQAILARLQTAPQHIDWPQVGLAAFQTLQSRDVLIWLSDPAVMDILSEQEWDGSVQPSSGDYWMLVDSNIGFNKVNAIIESSIAYTVTMQTDGSADAEMLIHYQHPGPAAPGCEHLQGYTLALSYDQLIQSCYYDYVRLLVPQDAQLKAAAPHPVPGAYLITGQPFDGATRVESEAGKTIFATLFVLERGQAIDLSFAYHLPAVARWTAQDGQYILLIQKQPGAAHRPVSVTLIWPEGYSVSQTSLPPTWSDDRSARFALGLSADQLLSVAWTHP